MSPKERKAHILRAAVTVATKRGYAAITREEVATAAGVGLGTVNLHWRTMPQLRRAVMGAAVAQEVLPIVAQGLAAGDPRARRAPEELRRRALASLA